MLLWQPIVCQSGALSCCSNVFHEPTVMLYTSKTVPNLDIQALFKRLPSLSQHIQACMLVNTVTNTPSRDVTSGATNVRPKTVTQCCSRRRGSAHCADGSKPSPRDSLSPEPGGHHAPVAAQARFVAAVQERWISSQPAKRAGNLLRRRVQGFKSQATLP